MGEARGKRPARKPFGDVNAKGVIAQKHITDTGDQKPRLHRTASDDSSSSTSPGAK